MKRIYLKLLGIIIFTFFYSESIQSQNPVCGNSELYHPKETDISDCSKLSDSWLNIYKTKEHYVPSPDMPVKTLHVNLNIWQRTDGTGNLSNIPEHISRLKQIMEWVNMKYENVNPNAIPPLTYSVESFTDSKIRIVLDSIYFYQDPSSDSAYYYGGNGQQTYGHNILLDNYIENNFPERTRALNIHLTGSEWSGVGGYSAYGSIESFYRRNPDMANNPVHDWWFHLHWAHEIGHSFDLWHTYGVGWQQNCKLPYYDFLTDLYDINFPCSGSCDICLITDYNNNLMGGDDEGHITGLQMGIIHRSTMLRNLHNVNYNLRDHVTGYTSTPYEITQNETWDFSIKFYQDIIVKAGNTLTIQCEVQMVPNTKIIVEPNAKLIIDGGLITNEYYYNLPWQGIQVWGDKTQSQYCAPGQACAQGSLELINGATIENAIIAVDLWKPGDYATTGGIVYATDAIFRNNAKSVHALFYKNFNPYDPDTELDYFSNFNNCRFEITADYLGDEMFHKHVDLAHVKGIDFYGCDFSLAEKVEGVSNSNHAIAAYNAAFKVRAICNSQTAPCPDADYDKCSFTGFYSAINAVNDGTLPLTFSVNRANFVKNANGVKTRNMNNTSVLFSNFEIGHFWDCATGIHADNVTGFAFEENNFSKYSGEPVSDYFGIIINNSGAINEVYKNNYTGLSYANFSERMNWTVEGRHKGLAYYCNENSNNYADFYVADNNFTNRSGIQSLQGSETYAAGNTFTQSGATWHFYNGGEHEIDYFYNLNNSIEMPDINKIYDVNIFGTNVSNTCPSHYGGIVSEKNLVLTAQQKAETEQAYYTNLTDYNSVKTLYDSYVDGGDTEATKLDIQTAQPDDMWELRAQLLGDSPHLSLDVLKEAADKTEVFTESALFDILAANPDELKKDTLLSYLENKEEPLPAYMIDLLKQLAGGTTYKTALHQQMAEYSHNYSRAAHDIIRSILNDTITDNVELRNWLDNLGGITSDRQIITSYISEGNFTDALALANMLPQLYNMKGTDLTEHSYYMDMLSLHQSLYQQGRNTFQLNSTEKADITFIANNSNDVAGAQAKSILEGVYDEHFNDCPDADGAAGYKSSSLIDPNALGKAYGLNISVKPNPAKQWAAFDYTLPGDETQATLTISNSLGNTVEILEISGQQGQKLWDTREIKPGVYIYTIQTSGFSQSGKIVISE